MGPSRVESTLRLLRLTMWVLLAPIYLKAQDSIDSVHWGTHIFISQPVRSNYASHHKHLSGHSAKKTEPERSDHTKAVGYMGSVFMPLFSRPPFWLVPFSAYNQLCAQWVEPAKWPFVGAIRHLCLQTSCKHLIVPACSHLWVQLSRNPGVPGIMHNLRGKKWVFSKKEGSSWTGALQTLTRVVQWSYHHSVYVEPLCFRKQCKPPI